MLEGKNSKENIKKFKEKTKHGTVSSWKWVGKWTTSLLGDYCQQRCADVGFPPVFGNKLK